jgi:hypothetical protein
MNDLIVGAWRNGLDANTQGAVEGIEKRRAAGFRLLPNDSVVADLADMLDSYDSVAEELLDDRVCDCYEEHKPTGKVRASV